MDAEFVKAGDDAGRQATGVALMIVVDGEGVRVGQERTFAALDFRTAIPPKAGVNS